MSLSYRTQQRLASLIQAIAEGEKKLEVVRQVLAEQRLFEPHTAFRRLDVTRDGYVSQSELVDFLNTNRIVSTNREQLALFAGLDANEDGLISYSDFVSTILPQEDEKLRNLATLRESQVLEAGQPLPYEVEWGLARIFEQEIKNYRTIENMKDILSSSIDYNTLDAFNAIDEEQLGFIDFESVDKFQRANSKILSSDEIQAFIRVVGDSGRITYTQFANAFGTNDRSVSSLSASKYERQASPYKSRDWYYNELQDQLNRSMERSRRALLESSLQQSQDRLERSIDLQRSQERVSRLEREIELQRSAERIARAERQIELQRSQERLQRSIDLRRSQQEAERALERQRSQERINELNRSIERSRIEGEIARQERLNNLNRSIEKSRIELEVSRNLERSRSQERIQDLSRSIERSRIQREVDSALERRRSQERINQLESSLRQSRIAREVDRELERQRSQEKINQLNRSIEQSRIEAEIARQERINELNRSIEKSRIQREVESTLQRQRSQERISQLEDSIRKSRIEREVNSAIERQRSQEKLEELSRSIERSKIQRDLERSMDLQRSRDRIQQIESEIEQRRFEEMRKSQEILNRSIERSRILQQEQELREVEENLERSRRLQRSSERLRDLASSQERLNRSIERSRLLQTEAELLRSQRERQFQQSALENELQRSIERSRRLEDEILDKSIRESALRAAEEANDELSRALSRQINLDRDIEDIRKQLALRVDFSTLDAFRVFDINGRGYVTKLEFEQALNKMQIYPNSDELYLLFKKYDSDSDGLIRYSEFTKILVPTAQEYANLMNNRQPNYADKVEGIDIFEIETRIIFKKLLQKVILGEIEAEKIRQDLSENPRFSATDAFTSLDQENLGFISEQEFRKILNDRGFFVSQNDLSNLLNKFDKDADGKITYGEFLSEITPKSPVKY
ncbi:hypothetical protein PPERSA_07449 [Pseudocohnilembus persalinus]|uniref:EF-hand domain-containing protein n=1 Tax=Pseudocohnilembus persalinus TaxID=266149 RepID=A0A0V0QAF4_PSEPJ|nr:hypothetical protein PPERSA_07449 [Pseudocohnilembus persalinus]|eukprot:KRW99206.1 hypothetical protein PPERSA_07449 [Pseudocohnilembus persalinus]